MKTTRVRSVIAAERLSKLKRKPFLTSSATGTTFAPIAAKMPRYPMYIGSATMTSSPASCDDDFVAGVEQARHHAVDRIGGARKDDHVIGVARAVGRSLFDTRNLLPQMQLARTGRVMSAAFPQTFDRMVDGARQGGEIRIPDRQQIDFFARSQQCRGVFVHRPDFGSVSAEALDASAVPTRKNHRPTPPRRTRSESVVAATAGPTCDSRRSRGHRKPRALKFTQLESASHPSDACGLRRCTPSGPKEAA